MAATLLVSCSSQAQNRSAVARQEEEGRPVVEAEPVRAITMTPWDVAMALASGDQRQLSRVWGELFETAVPVPDDIDSAQLAQTNLDSDRELEAVVWYSFGRRESGALIFDRQNGMWTRVGNFAYTFHWNPGDSARHVELRETVWPGVKDVVVRTMSGGTGVARTDASVYRLLRGRLFRVLSVTELWERTVVEQGISDVRTDAAQLLFDQETSGEPTIHVLERSYRFLTEHRHLIRERCLRYRWEPRTFAFGRAEVEVHSSRCEIF